MAGLVSGKFDAKTPSREGAKRREGARWRPAPISFTWSTTVFLAHLLVGGLLWAMLSYFVSACEPALREFGTKLPAAIAIPQFVSRYWYFYAVPAIADAAILFGFRETRLERRWLLTLWAVAVLLAMVLLAGFVFVAMALPLVRVRLVS